MSLSVDLLIQARWIIPVEKDGEVLDNHALAISQGKIVAIVPPEGIAQVSAKEHLTLNTHALIPGLVNLHCHAAMTPAARLCGRLGIDGLAAKPYLASRGGARL